MGGGNPPRRRAARLFHQPPKSSSSRSETISHYGESNALGIIKRTMEVALMFTSGLHGLFMGLFDLAIFAAGAIYTGLVLTSYRINGPHYRPHFSVYAPAVSAERLLVWLGVKTLAVTIR